MTDALRWLIVGCGDTGRRVAARTVAAGHDVTAIVASHDSAARARALGATTHVIDLDHDTPEALSCDRLIYSAPPPRAGPADTRMDRVIAALSGGPPPLTVYISTSGVYGDAGGDWVDETRPLAPGTDRARRRVDAEQRIARFQPEVRILRAPGIYGPGRLPVERVRAAEPVLADDESGWTNRIHIDDLASIAWQAADRAWPGGAINASDGTPTRLSAYYDALAEMLGVDPPPRISWDAAEAQFSSMRLSFLRESRRLDNRRLLSTLDTPLAYPDFHQGLAASLPAAV